MEGPAIGLVVWRLLGLSIAASARSIAGSRLQGGTPPQGSAAGRPAEPAMSCSLSWTQQQGLG